MTGGWGGYTDETWIVSGGGRTQRGAQTCNFTWLVNVQDPSGAFRGTYQRSLSASCADSGTIEGTTSVDRAVRVRLRSTVSASTCALLNGDTEYRGFLSQTGTLTAQRDYAIRCPAPGVPFFDYVVTGTLTMNRR
jgi:hypothetical protein